MKIIRPEFWDNKKTRKLILEHQLEDLKIIRLNYQSKVLKYQSYQDSCHNCLVQNYQDNIKQVDEDIKKIEEELKEVEQA